MGPQGFGRVQEGTGGCRRVRKGPEGSKMVSEGPGGSKRVQENTSLVGSGKVWSRRVREGLGEYLRVH